MPILDLIYTDPAKDKPQVEWECGRGKYPLDMITSCPWEIDAAECFSTVYWVRDELGKILAVGLYRPGTDPLHPDLIVVCGGETRIYRYEETPESYRARLVSVVRLPQGV